MSTAAILVGAKTEILLRQLSSLWGYFSTRVSLCLSVCPSVCLSFWLHVCLSAQLHSSGPWVIRPRCQFWIWKVRIWVRTAVSQGTCDSIGIGVDSALDMSDFEWSVHQNSRAYIRAHKTCYWVRFFNFAGHTCKPVVVYNRRGTRLIWITWPISPIFNQGVEATRPSFAVPQSKYFCAVFARLQRLTTCTHPRSCDRRQPEAQARQRRTLFWFQRNTAIEALEGFSKIRAV